MQFRSTALATSLACGLALTGAAEGKMIVGLDVDGSAAYITEAANGSPITTIGNPFATGDTPVLWAGVAAYDVDPNSVGDEIILSRQLNQAPGNGGLEVYSNQPGVGRVGFDLPGYDLAGLEIGQVLTGGTAPGLVAVRPDISQSRPLFEIWDPQNALSGGGRESFQRNGSTIGATWNPSVVDTGELFTSGAGDEVVVIRDTTRRVEIFGRTGGTGDNTYTRVSTFNAFNDTASVAVAPGVLDNGSRGVVAVLRDDGRITFYDAAAGVDISSRIGFTDPTGLRENFIEVADVIDSNPGLEIITSYNDSGSQGGVVGYQVYDLPDLAVGVDNLLPLTTLATVNTGASLRDIDLITIPEPGSLALLALGGTLVLSRRRS